MLSPPGSLTLLPGRGAGRRRRRRRCRRHSGGGDVGEGPSAGEGARGGGLTEVDTSVPEREREVSSVDETEVMLRMESRPSRRSSIVAVVGQHALRHHPCTHRPHR